MSKSSSCHEVSKKLPQNLEPEYEIVYYLEEAKEKFDDEEWNKPQECWNCGTVTESWIRKYWTYVIECNTTSPAPIQGATNLCPSCADRYTPVPKGCPVLDKYNDIIIIYRHRKK